MTSEQINKILENNSLGKCPICFKKRSELNPIRDIKDVPFEFEGEVYYVKICEHHPVIKL